MRYEGYPCCPYCGRPLRGAALTCAAHADLPAREPFDDRYTLSYGSELGVRRGVSLLRPGVGGFGGGG